MNASAGAKTSPGTKSTHVVSPSHSPALQPLPDQAALSAALAYLDSYRRERLPANLLQAMRDDFGAHTYERVDRDGSFHTEWE